MINYELQEVKNFWLNRWEYITCFDACKEARKAGFAQSTLRELVDLYKEVYA